MFNASNEIHEWKYVYCVQTIQTVRRIFGIFHFVSDVLQYLHTALHSYWNILKKMMIQENRQIKVTFCKRSSQFLFSTAQQTKLTLVILTCVGFGSQCSIAGYYIDWRIGFMWQLLLFENAGINCFTKEFSRCA